MCAKRKWLCYSPHTLIKKPDVKDKEIGEKERKKDKKIKSGVVAEYQGRPRKNRKDETIILTFSQVELKIYDRHNEPCKMTEYDTTLFSYQNFD